MRRGRCALLELSVRTSWTPSNTFLLLPALLFKARVSGTRGGKSISRNLNRSFLVPGSARRLEHAFFLEGQTT
jgi:hypothetical protein